MKPKSSKNAPKRYTLQEAFESVKLEPLIDILPDKCTGTGIALFSEFTAFASRYKHITGIDLGQPIEAAGVLISDEDITELNTRVKDINIYLINLCKCMSEKG